MKSPAFLRLVVFVICFAIVWLASAPTFAGGLLFKRLRPRVAATQKTVTIQKQATATVSSSGGCRMIDGRLVCPRR